MKNLKFEDLPKALELALEKLALLDLKLQDLSAHFQPKEPIELMTRIEVSELLKINLSTVHNWTKKGKLQSYGIGGRVYYKRGEIMNSLIKLSA